MKTSIDRSLLKTRITQGGVLCWLVALSVHAALALALSSLPGCGGQKEIEYPPEVIPNIPPGDRSSDVVDPPK
mgnify:CR=1 FL=1